MKKVQWFLGIVFSLALILVLLINSFQFAAYGDFGFYEKEYKKYDVVSDLDMELKDVMYVTYEMMDYLIGVQRKSGCVHSGRRKRAGLF